MREPRWPALAALIQRYNIRCTAYSFQIGAMNFETNQWLQRYYDAEAQGTDAQLAQAVVAYATSTGYRWKKNSKQMASRCSWSSTTLPLYMHHAPRRPMSVALQASQQGIRTHQLVGLLSSAPSKLALIDALAHVTRDGKRHAASAASENVDVTKNSSTNDDYFALRPL